MESLAAYYGNLWSRPSCNKTFQYIDFDELGSDHNDLSKSTTAIKDTCRLKAMGMGVGRTNHGLRGAGCGVRVGVA